MTFLVEVGHCWRRSRRQRKLNILAEACCWLSFLQIIHKPHIWWCGNYSCCFLLSFHVSTPPALRVVYCAENFIVRKTEKCLTSTGKGGRVSELCGGTWKVLKYVVAWRKCTSTVKWNVLLEMNLHSLLSFDIEQRWKGDFLISLSIWLKFGLSGRVGQVAVFFWLENFKLFSTE